MTLAYAGCRASEALVFATLKKRQEGVYRAVDAIDLVHGIRELQARRGKGRSVRLWPWSRMTGWRAVHAVMETAGSQASPKGLRHGFGVAAVSAGIPLNLVQRWLGPPSSAPPRSMPTRSAQRNKEIARGMWG